MPYRENSIHLWTQTPAGGLPPSKYKAVEKKPEEKPADEKKEEMPRVVGPKRKSRYWKNFYRKNTSLLKGAYDPDIWQVYSGRQEDSDEPTRSKFWRRHFRKHPQLYQGYQYGDSDDSDSEFDSDMSSEDSDSDSDAEIISSSSGPTLRTLNFHRRQESIARAERDEQARRALKQKYLEMYPESEDARWNSDSSDDDDDDKHVHWSDEEGKIKPILKQTKNAERSNVIVKKPEPRQIMETPRQQPSFVEFPNCYQQSRAPLSALNVFVQHSEPSSGAKRTVVEVDRRRAAPQSSTSGDSRIFNPRDNHNSQLSRLRSRPSNFNTPLSPPPSPLNLNAYSQSNYYHPHTFDYYIYCKGSRSFYPVGQGVLCDFWPTLGLYLPRTMETTSSRTVLPVEAKVLVVEHVVELPSDPRPNAFYDSGSNTLRVYHGQVYGNPNGMSIPVRTENIYHANPLIGAGGGFGALGAPVGPFTMGARPGLLQGPFGPVNPAADVPCSGTFYPGTGLYADASLPPDLERHKRDAEYAAVLQACRRAEYGRYMDSYIAQGKLRESMNQNQNQQNNGNGGGNSKNWNGNGNGNGSPNQNNRNRSGNGNGNGYGNSNNSGSQNNRNFSGQSANRNQNQNGNNQNGNNRNFPQQSSNRNQSQSNRTNSRNKSSNGRNHSRSNTGNQNSNSNSGGGDACGDDDWGNDNSGGGGQDASWKDSSNDNSNNNNNDSRGDDNNGMSSDPAPASSPSPTVTVIHHDTSDPFSSEINVRIVVDADEAVNVTVVNDDGSRTPTETRAYMPCSFPDSPSQNNAYDSGYGNSKDNYNSNSHEIVDEWGNVISGDNNNSNDNNDPRSNDNNDDEDEADAWGGSSGEKTPSPPRNFGNNGTELSAGSWASKNNTPIHTPTPASRKENRNNNSGSRNDSSNKQNNSNSWNSNQKSNGYNLKQTNGNQNNDTWGDPTAAQSTGSNLSGGW